MGGRSSREPPSPVCRTAPLECCRIIIRCGVAISLSPLNPHPASWDLRYIRAEPNQAEQLTRPGLVGLTWLAPMRRKWILYAAADRLLDILLNQDTF